MVGSMDIAQRNGDNAGRKLERQPPIGKDDAMGDKGGKKDKEKSKKQKASKQGQSAKGQQNKTHSK
jgi:hypothetical protein